MDTPHGDRPAPFSAEMLHEELRSAIAVREKYRAKVRQAEERFALNRHDDKGAGEDDPERRIYELVATNMVRLAMHNPRVRMGSEGESRAQMVAGALKHSVNRGFEDTNFKFEAQMAARDVMLGWSILHTCIEPAPYTVPNDHEDPVRPRTHNLDPDRFVMDPWCRHWTEARFLAHELTCWKSELEQHARDNPDEGWDMEAVQDLAEDAQGVGFEDGDAREQLHGNANEKPARGEVRFWQIWVPRATQAMEDDDPIERDEEWKYNGWLFYLALNEGGDEAGELRWIRKPQRYLGPPEGPYEVIGIWDVNKTPYHLSPAVAILESIDLFNSLVHANLSAERDHKRMVLVDSTDEELAETIRDGEDGLVVRVQGLDKDRIFPVEIGGPTATGYLAEDRHRQRLDRLQGTDPSQAGSAQAGVTATATISADQAAEALRSFFGERFHTGIERVARRHAFYNYALEDVRIPGPPDAAAELGMEQPWYVGGPEPGVTFAELELRLDAMSMEHTSAGLHAARLERFYGWLFSVAPLFPTMPFLEVREAVRQYAEALNLFEVEALINDKILYSMAEMNALQVGAATSPDQGRMGRDMPGSASPSSSSGGGASSSAQQNQKDSQAGAQSAAQPAGAGGGY